MEQSGYKHFSHAHNLIIHQMPEGIDVSCSGCNSSGNGSVYVCWRCNFFLHEQCYRAVRSLNHPSHPHHPLTLLPYPTYLSNSFYCNSCQLIGTGISYSCADCEFDLHVQCAYSISRATNHFQELVPSTWNGQNYYMIHNSISSDQSYSIPSGHQNSRVPSMAQNLHSDHDPFMAHQTTSQNPISNVPYSSIPTNSQNPIASSQYHSMSATEPCISIPPNYPVSSSQDPSRPQTGPCNSQKPSIAQTNNYPIPRDQDAPMPHNGPSVSVPTSSDNHISSVQYPFMTQSGPSESIHLNPPNTFPNTQDVSAPTSSHNPIPSVQYPSMTHTVSIPINPPNPTPNNQAPQNEPSVSIPMSSQSPVSRDQTGHSVSVPTNPIPSTQDPPTMPPVSIPPITSSAQYPSMSQTVPSVYAPTNPPNPITTFQHPPVPQNETKDKEIRHFSHSHNLYVDDFQEDEENEVTCSACEDTLVGKGYPCVQTDCDFLLHESCFHLKKEIQHKSHPEHPLTLLPLAPYNNKNGEFTCNACFSDGTGFTYNCSICTFDLHIQCVSLPETVKRDDHEHVLKLFYSCPAEGEEDIVCDVCHGSIQKDRWVYYCESCDYGTHLGCVDCEECEGDNNLESSILNAQAQLQRLQIQMEMSRQQAQFMASMGASLANLV